MKWLFPFNCFIKVPWFILPFVEIYTVYYIFPASQISLNIMVYSIMKCCTIYQVLQTFCLITLKVNSSSVESIHQWINRKCFSIYRDMFSKAAIFIKCYCIVPYKTKSKHVKESGCAQNIQKREKSCFHGFFIIIIWYISGCNHCKLFFEVHDWKYCIWKNWYM